MQTGLPWASLRHSEVDIVPQLEQTVGAGVAACGGGAAWYGGVWFGAGTLSLGQGRLQ